MQWGSNPLRGHIRRAHLGRPVVARDLRGHLGIPAVSLSALKDWTFLGDIGIQLPFGSEDPGPPIPVRQLMGMWTDC